MPAGRPKGAKNRRPVGEEFVKKAALLRAEARLARRVPYDLDKDEKLDPMEVLEEAMQHFYRKAKIEETFRPVLRFSDCGQCVSECGPDCARDCVFPAPAYQCRKAGCRRSECRFVTWGYDSGRDARDYPAQTRGRGVVASAS